MLQLEEHSSLRDPIVKSERLMLKITRGCGLVSILISLFGLAIPPAFSSSLVDAIRKSPPADAYNVADRGIAGLMWMFGAVYIILAIVIIVCSSVALKRVKDIDMSSLT
jgi:hypothetical protein